MKIGKISPELVLKIKDAINILDVIGEHVVLRKSGANHTGLCPFHSERTPSFSVSESKKLYHCYGCKKGGDLIHFVMDIMGLSFAEAVEELADRAQIVLPKADRQSLHGDSQGAKQRERQALAFKLNRFVAAYFHQRLRSITPAFEYLQFRGTAGDELVNSYYVGAAADAWEGLAHELTIKKAPLDMALELGLIRTSKKSGGTGYFDLFRNRVLFPIINLRGKVAGFGGRILGPEEPKYLNSPESFLFQKSKLAFGLYQAQKYIREQDEVIVVEGYFDVLGMYKAGFRNVVATCGTSVTHEHLQLFKRFASKVTLLFDGDAAGQAATERAMETGLDCGIVLYGAQMPQGLDPDQMVLDSKTGQISADGKARMTALLQAAEPILDSKIKEYLPADRESSEDRVKSLKKIGSWLARFQDPIGKEVRVQWIEKQLGVSPDLIERAIQGERKRLGPTANSPLKKAADVQFSKVIVRNGPVVTVKMSDSDRVLLMGITLGPKYTAVFQNAGDHLPPQTSLGDLLEYPAARTWIHGLFSTPSQLEKWNINPGEILDDDLDMYLRSILTEGLVTAASLGGMESAISPSIDLKEFRGALTKSLARSWTRFSQRIKLAMVEAESHRNVDRQTQLMKEYLDVQRKMKEFINFYDQE